MKMPLLTFHCDAKNWRYCPSNEGSTNSLTTDKPVAFRLRIKLELRKLVSDEGKMPGEKHLGAKREASCLFAC